MSEGGESVSLRPKSRQPNPTQRNATQRTRQAQSHAKDKREEKGARAVAVALRGGVEEPGAAEEADAVPQRLA